MFIDTNTPKADLLNAIYGDWSLLEVFMDADLDPEFMDQAEIAEIVTKWIEDGDECAR